MDNTYTIDGQTLTFRHWNLLRVMATGKWHPLCRDNRFITKGSETPEGALQDLETRSLFGTLAGTRWRNVLQDLVRMDLVKASTSKTGPQEFYVRNKALKMGFDPSVTPIAPGTRRPVFTGIDAECDSPEVLNSLSLLSKQGYCYNAVVAAKIRRDIEDGNMIFGPAAEARTEGKEYGRNEALMSIKRLMGKCPNTPLHSDVFLDWRGRVNHMSATFASFQQNLLQRACLSAPKAVEVAVDSPEWDYMLQQFAHEGVTLDNYSDMLAAPIATADDAIEYRMAFTIMEIITTGKTDFMLEQDASCSGGQIIAMLTGDMDLARATNLINTDGDRQDIYTDLVSNERFDNVWEECPMPLKDKRAIAKPVIMISFYGGGPAGILANMICDARELPDMAIDERLAMKNWAKDYVKYASFKKFDQESVDNLMDTAVKEGFATITFGSTEVPILVLREIIVMCSQILPKMFPGFASFLKWKDVIAKSFAVGDEGAKQWITPNGMTINHPDPASLLPNYIHSVDGAIVQRVIGDDDMLGKALAVVHDAFFTTVDNAMNLAHVVRDNYVGVCQDAITALPTEAADALVVSIEDRDAIHGGLHRALVLGA